MSLVTVIFAPIIESWPIVTGPATTLLGEIWTLSSIIGNVCYLSIYLPDFPPFPPIVTF